MVTLSTDFARKILKERPVDMHKGHAGRILISAGSRGMAGAAVLAARGALYSGAGLVRIGGTEDIMDILQCTVPEATCLDRSKLKKEDLTAFDAIAAGPGMGVNEDTHMLVSKILEESSHPVVLDADALTCIACYGMPHGSGGSVVMTPHTGEAMRLVKGLGIIEKCDTRENTAKAIANKTGAIVVLKGHNSIVASPEGETFLNPTGNPGMATGGSGDVLTGMIAALLGGRYLDASPLEAVCTATFMHGLAGDIAAENIGETGMTAADIADGVSVAFKEITVR